MLRLLLILLLCALFAACSSDNSATFKEWFDDQGIATSYGKDFQEIEVSFKNSSLGYDSSAYIVKANSYAVLGNVNNVEQMLYMRIIGTSHSVWKFIADSTFYANFYEGNVPEEHKKLEARFYWLTEEKIEEDTTWIKFQKPFKDSADISIDWTAGETRDTFSISLPEELKSKADSLMLIGIKLLTNDVVLRIVSPTILSIPNLLRVAQKTHVESCGDLCLHAGIGESLDVVLKVDDKNKIKAGKTVVFAQLILPKTSSTEGSELGFPVPVYVLPVQWYSNGSLVGYMIDTAFVENYGHTNLIFGEGDTLKLQVTEKLRSYASSANLSDTIGFTLELGSPMLNPKSFSFYSPRPAYASYDFSTAFEGKVKLRLWYAETD